MRFGTRKSTCTSLLLQGLCRPTHEQKKEPWPAGEAGQAAGDADPLSRRTLLGTGYGTVQLKEGA